MLWKLKNRLLQPILWGNMRSVTPKSRNFGVQRGTPVDRYYIEGFLEEHKSDIRGFGLEIASDAYLRRFGGSAIERTDVLSIAAGPGVTIVGDMTLPETLPSEQYDCIVLTQTLQFIYDFRGALDSIFAALKPGGVLLITVPGISQISDFDLKQSGDFWRFTHAALSRLLAEYVPADHLTVKSYGNVLAAVSFLHGVSREELRDKELDYLDNHYEVTVAGRAVKP